MKIQLPDTPRTTIPQARISVSTAECFTHGFVARELHAFGRGYPRSYQWRLKSEEYQLSLVAGLFIPTLSGLRTVLDIDPLIPVATDDDIKIYNQEQDLAMALRMATAVRAITGSEIGIGTTAGIGTGGIGLVGRGITLTGTTSTDADLRTSDPETIMKRSQEGVEKALHMLEVAISRTQ